MTKQKKKLLESLLKEYKGQLITQQGNKTDTGRLIALQEKMQYHITMAQKYAILRRKQMNVLSKETVDSYTGMDVPHFMDALHKMFMAFMNGNLINKTGLIQYFKQ